jgi:hypothetical protein
VVEYPTLNRKVGISSIPVSTKICYSLRVKTKFCKKCDKDVDFDLFGKKASKPDGKQDWCRDCKIKYNKEWYAANGDRHREYVGTHKPRKDHKCKHCGRGEPEATFYRKRVKDKFYPRFICHECDREYRKKYPTSEAALTGQKKRRSARKRVNRTIEIHRCKYILGDSQRDDRKKGRQNDLDRDFIRTLIDEGCAYCADREARMTLDRVDNSLGHLKSNVVASCMRCNYFRRDMPHDAWMMIAPKIRQARLLGLLDGWNPGTVKSQRKTSPKDVEILKEL